MVRYYRQIGSLNICLLPSPHFLPRFVEDSLVVTSTHLLAGVLTKLFADRQVEVDPAVIQYLLKRMERSLEGANLLVERLDAAALARKSRITRTLAAEVLEDER